MQCKIKHEDDDIPEFLCRTCHPELNASGPLTGNATAALDPVEERQRTLRAAQQRTQKTKRAAALQKHLDAHTFDTWDAKNKVWERDEKKIAAYNAQLEAEFERGLEP